MDFQEILSLVTPVAVAIAVVVQKLDARKVHTVLATENVKRNEKLDEIHDLVNGNLSEKTRLSMLQARRIAQLTRDPTDAKIADDAELAYATEEARKVRITLAAAHAPNCLLACEDLKRVVEELASVKGELALLRLNQTKEKHET